MNSGDSDARERRSRSVKLLIPREHGAWGLVLQPFAAASLLAWRWDLLLMPAFFLVLIAFVVREPLTILVRRQWAGHAWNSQARTALHWLAVEVTGLFLCFAIVANAVPWFPLSLLTALGCVMTIVSVWFAVKNRQRSINLQIVAVAGLGSGAFVAALVCHRTISTWVWLLWAILSLHGIISVLCVHARLEMRISATHSSGMSARRIAAGGAVLQLLTAFPAALIFGFAVVIPIVFSSVVHAVELQHLSSPVNVREPLPRVGFRMLGSSLIHMALTVAVLWHIAHP